MEKKCFFCHLAKDPNKKKLILEDENFFSIYDDSPVSPGHAIAVPKNHIVSYFDLTMEQMEKMHGFILKVKAEIDKKHNPDAYNIGINDGTAAGRTIDHLHVHIMPRYEGDVENPRGGVRNLLGKYVPPEAVPEDFG